MVPCLQHGTTSAQACACHAACCSCAPCAWGHATCVLPATPQAGMTDWVIPSTWACWKAPAIAPMLKTGIKRSCKAGGLHALPSASSVSSPPGGGGGGGAAFLPAQGTAQSACLQPTQSHSSACLHCEPSVLASWHRRHHDAGTGTLYRKQAATSCMHTGSMCVHHTPPGGGGGGGGAFAPAQRHAHI